MRQLGRHLALAAVLLAIAFAAASCEPASKGARSPSTTSRFAFSGDWRHATGPGYLTRAAASDYTSLLEQSPDRLQIVTAPLRRGNFTLKLTLNQGDYEHNGVSERCELAANAVTYEPGDEFWVAMSIYLDPSFPIPAREGWAVFHQFYGETDGQSTGSPPIALELTSSGNFALTVRGGAKESAGSAAPKEVSKPFARVTRREWHDFLLHVRLATTSAGLVEVWHRIAGEAFAAAPNARVPGTNVLTVDGVDQKVYPETGYYRSTDPRQAVLYSGGLWIRATRSQAAAYFGPNETTAARKRR
jgi:polysaccharide lyase-like protein